MDFTGQQKYGRAFFLPHLQCSNVCEQTKTAQGYILWWQLNRRHDNSTIYVDYHLCGTYSIKFTESVICPWQTIILTTSFLTARLKSWIFLWVSALLILCKTNSLFVCSNIPLMSDATCCKSRQWEQEKAASRYGIRGKKSNLSPSSN